MRQLTDTPYHEFGPNFSPDSSKIVFMADRTGRYEVYVLSKNDTGRGEPEQLTFDGGTQPRWSPSGNSIAYISGEDLKIVSFGDGKSKMLIKGQNASGGPMPESIAWSPDGTTVYFQARDDQGIEGIWSVPVGGGEPGLKIISDDPLLKLGLYNFCADNQRFYFSFRLVESNLWIMDLISQE